VTAVGAAGEQVSSGQTAAARPCVAPAAPGNVTAAAQPGGGIRVSWSAPAGAGGSTRYAVSYSGPTSGTVQTTATSYDFGAGQLTFLGSYTFTVTAQNGAGASAGASASARSGGTGQSFAVDVTKTRTDPVNPCIDVPNCRATMRQGPSHQTAATGAAPQGATVVGYCYRSDGQTIRSDDGAQSTYWILIESGGARGFVSTLWLGGANAWQRVWQCPANYTA
jgi:hypothetical protein